MLFFKEIKRRARNRVLNREVTKIERGLEEIGYIQVRDTYEYGVGIIGRAMLAYNDMGGKFLLDFWGMIKEGNRKKEFDLSKIICIGNKYEMERAIIDKVFKKHNYKIESIKIDEGMVVMGYEKGEYFVSVNLRE